MRFENEQIFSNNHVRRKERDVVLTYAILQFQVQALDSTCRSRIVIFRIVNDDDIVKSLMYMKFVQSELESNFKCHVVER